MAGDPKRIFAVQDSIVFPDWGKAKPGDVLKRKLLLRNGNAKHSYTIRVNDCRSDKFHVDGSEVDGFVSVELGPGASVAIPLEFTRLRKKEDTSKIGNWRDYVTISYSQGMFDVPVLAVKKGSSAPENTFVPTRRELDAMGPPLTENSILSTISHGTESHRKHPKVLVDEEVFNELASLSEDTEADAVLLAAAQKNKDGGRTGSVTSVINENDPMLADESSKLVSFLQDSLKASLAPRAAEDSPAVSRKQDKKLSKSETKLPRLKQSESSEKVESTDEILGRPRWNPTIKLPAPEPQPPLERPERPEIIAMSPRNRVYEKPWKVELGGEESHHTPRNDNFSLDSPTLPSVGDGPAIFIIGGKAYDSRGREVSPKDVKKLRKKGHTVSVLDGNLVAGNADMRAEQDAPFIHREVIHAAKKPASLADMQDDSSWAISGGVVVESDTPPRSESRSDCEDVESSSRGSSSGRPLSPMKRVKLPPAALDIPGNEYEETDGHNPVSRSSTRSAGSRGTQKSESRGTTPIVDGDSSPGSGHMLSSEYNDGDERCGDDSDSYSDQGGEDANWNGEEDAEDSGNAEASRALLGDFAPLVQKNTMMYPPPDESPREKRPITNGSMKSVASLGSERDVRGSRGTSPRSGRNISSRPSTNGSVQNQPLDALPDPTEQESGMNNVEISSIEPEQTESPTPGTDPSKAGKTAVSAANAKGQIKRKGKPRRYSHVKS